MNVKALAPLLVLIAGCAGVDRTTPPVRESEADVVLTNRAIVRELLRERARTYETRNEN